MKILKTKHIAAFMLAAGAVGATNAAGAASGAAVVTSATAAVVSAAAARAGIHCSKVRQSSSGSMGLAT